MTGDLSKLSLSLQIKVNSKQTVIKVKPQVSFVLFGFVVSGFSQV